MARSLSIHRAIVPTADRARYLGRLKARKEHYERSRCKFWVFEEASMTGAFIEFTESADATALVAAHAGAPEPVLDPSRVYTEVELD